MKKEEIINHDDFKKIAYTAIKHFNIYEKLVTINLSIEDFIHEVSVNMFLRGVSENHSMSLNIYKHCLWTIYRLIKPAKNKVITNQNLSAVITRKDYIEEIDRNEELNTIINNTKLSKLQKEVVLDYLLDPKISNIAKSNNCSVQNINNIFLNSVKKLKDTCND